MIRRRVFDSTSRRAFPYKIMKKSVKKALQPIDKIYSTLRTAWFGERPDRNEKEEQQCQFPFRLTLHRYSPNRPSTRTPLSKAKPFEQLSSGYRINSSGDDAAGLAVANQYRSTIAELQQGVLNASNGTSILQIVDGGLNNISTILDRLQTLATESASATFAGNRNTLNQEFQSLVQEITRQANNIGLASGGTVQPGELRVHRWRQQRLKRTGQHRSQRFANQVDAAGLGLGHRQRCRGRHGALARHREHRPSGCPRRDIPCRCGSDLHPERLLIQRRRADPHAYPWAEAAH